MKINSALSFILLIVAFVVFAYLNSLLFSGVRLDMTDNKLYTLSDGTARVLADIDEPVNLYFFFSEKASEDLTSLRAYAQRVKEMLQEYQLEAGDGINLRIIDPEPFSEEEDLAAEFGLQSVPVSQAGDELYFGLAGTNALDDQEVISFFQPDKEEFLEYELSKLIYSLSVIERPRVAIYSDLPIDQDVDPTTYQTRSAWVFLVHLQELFDVEIISELTSEELSAFDLLMVVHPKDPSEEALFAIDQFVMKGGKLIAFVDPLAEMDRPGNPGMMPGMQGSSNLNELTSAWGVTLRENEILGDAVSALTVADATGAPVRHLGILGLTAENLAREDIVTSALESVNVATIGIFDIDETDGIKVEAMMKSSTASMALPALQFQFLSDPADLQRGFAPTGEEYVIAVRLSGGVTTAFPDGIAETDDDVIQSTDELQAVLIADTDILSDRMWVQVQSFFGQQIATAWADNGSFVTNLVDNLSGSSDLIDVRSRGQFTRPFTVVQELRRSAEASYLQSAEDLQRRLNETEDKLSELESARVDDGVLTLNEEQQDAIIQFQEEKLKIRKELRDVRHQLDKDIERLGTMLKFINILLMPVVLIGLLLLFRLFRQRQAVLS